MGYGITPPGASEKHVIRPDESSVAPDFCLFMAKFTGNRKDIKELADSIRGDIARHVRSAATIMAGTSADTPDTRALILRYIDRFTIEAPNYGDRLIAEMDLRRAEALLEAALDRVPTRSEVSVMLVSVLRLCATEVLGGGAV